MSRSLAGLYHRYPWIYYSILLLDYSSSEEVTKFFENYCILTLGWVDSDTCNFFYVYYILLVLVINHSWFIIRLCKVCKICLYLYKFHKILLYPLWKRLHQFPFIFFHYFHINPNTIPHNPIVQCIGWRHVLNKQLYT